MLWDLLRFPRFPALALVTRRLVDLDHDQATAQVRSPPCRYQRPPRTQPSRINGCLVDVRMASLAEAVCAMPAESFLAHRPVAFMPNMPHASQQVYRLVRPPQL